MSLVLFSIFTPLFSGMIRNSALGGLDQGLGFLFGALRGILLVAVAFFVYQSVMESQELAMVDNSRAVVVFSQLTGSIQERDPEAALGWITTQYEQLTGDCGEPATPTDN